MKTLLTLLILVSTNAIAQEITFDHTAQNRDVTFQVDSEPLITFTENGRILFNRKKFKHYQPEDFAAKFIKIVEDMRLPKCASIPCNCLVNPINLDLGDNAESESRWVRQLQRISEFRKASFAECKRMRDEK